MDRSTLCLLLVFLGVGAGMASIRQYVFGQREIVAHVEEVDSKLSSAMEEVLRGESKAQSLKQVETTGIPEQNLSDGQISEDDENRKDLIDQNLQNLTDSLERAPTIEERMNIMNHFSDGDLVQKSDQALGKSLIFLRSEIEYLGSNYLDRFDSPEFDAYLSELLYYHRSFELEQFSRAKLAPRRGMLIDELSKSDLHPDVLRKIKNYIHIGNAE